MSRLVLATRNAHKLAEVRRLLAPARIAVEPLPDAVELPPEDGDSYAANALPKAQVAAAALGLAAIADDSGIEALRLVVVPGVRSARYAGERASDQENLAKLMREAPAGSELVYVCALAYVDPAVGIEQIFTGRCAGRLSGEPRGSRGFGYDPAFIPDDLPPDAASGTTMAQLSDAQKDAISHRGRAVRAFAAWLGS